MNWLKKLVGRASEKQPDGPLDHARELLREDFTALDQMQPGLDDRALRYVMNGEDEEVLHFLARLPGAGRALRLWCVVGGLCMDPRLPRFRFYETFGTADPAVILRLSKLLQAAACMDQKFLRHDFGNPDLDWLEILLGEVMVEDHGGFSKFRATPPARAEFLEQLLQADGQEPGLLVRWLFSRPAERNFAQRWHDHRIGSLPGFSEAILRQRVHVEAALLHPDWLVKKQAMDYLAHCHSVEAFLNEIVELAVDPSKQIRAQAELLLAGFKTVVRTQVESKIINGSNNEKCIAVSLLWRWEGESARNFLVQRLTEETSKKVAQTIRDLLAEPVPVLNASADDFLRLPNLPPIPAHLPLGPETEQAWHHCFQEINAGIARLLAGGKKHAYGKDLNPFPSATIHQAFADFAGGECGRTLGNLSRLLTHKEMMSPVKSFWQRPELQPVHFVRFMYQSGGLETDLVANNHGALFGYWHGPLVMAYFKSHPAVGWRELGAAFTAAGFDASRIGKGLLRPFGYAESFGLSGEKIWTYWAEHLDLLESAFVPDSKDYITSYYQSQSRPAALGIIASFPQPPARLQPLLWSLALGPKSERAAAQKCLANIPDKRERLVAALAAGGSETRFSAAEWLGRLGDHGAVNPLIEALHREKNEAAKSAMMGALEQLGASVDQFIDRAGLLQEAEKGMSKAVPEDLTWFPFDQLPPVHWQDNGKVIAPIILRWWLVQGFKLKSPEPGALLRRYCTSIHPPQRETLGQFILEAWIAEDTAPIPRDEAEKRAQAHAQSMAHFAQYFARQAQNNPPNQGAPPPPPMTAEQYFAQALPNFLKQPKGSAIAAKGILSVAGACVGADAAPVASRYLKEWYGQRAAQCRALLQMLAWAEHRTATQLLLAVGSRFRTKSIQEEANAQAQALADRKGWTVAELADRTIPSAGLDETGIMTIDFGPRQFTAKLNEDLDFVLADAEGKVLKALPEPRKDDDEAKAAEAKKNYSAAKKELKTVLTMQRDRLYEAMCTQRTWSFEDWSLYLNRHPIVRHHCERLIWAVVRDGKAEQLFRPLADGSLTDVADDPVTLKAEELIRVAHECQVTPEQSQVWRQHFKDYDVETLFDQFGRQNFNLSEENRNEADITDFQGHVLEAFKLRGRANKLGYTRGQAQDGGWFFDYHKRFPTLGIEATIEFTGNGMPEENRTVALTILHFDRVAEAGELLGGVSKMMLSEVPSVLLSECWNDIRAIAAEGPGFDPAWEKTTQF